MVIISSDCMANFFYNRAAVPLTEQIQLEVQFKDSAGNPKDTDSFPVVEITDAATVVVQPATDSGVIRLAVGRYRFDFTVPMGYTVGIWNDRWQAQMDGYVIDNMFDFNVTSVGSVEETGISVPPVHYELTDPDLEPVYTQEEIKGILLLRGLLKARLRSTAFKPDGTPCPVFSDEVLLQALRASLSELNATPTITGFTFADLIIQDLASDLITQGAMLICWSGQAIIEAGFEFTVNDNGVTVNPPPVSASINTQYSANLSDYRAKLKEFKRNLRPGGRAMLAGGLLGLNPRVLALRHRKQNRLI